MTSIKMGASEVSTYAKFDRSVMRAIERNALSFFLGMAAMFVVFLGIAR